MATGSMACRTVATRSITAATATGTTATTGIARGGLSIVVGAPIGAFVPLLPLVLLDRLVGRRAVLLRQRHVLHVERATGRVRGRRSARWHRDRRTDAPPSDEIFVYPRNGQSADQQARDRYECHRSAVDQTGFDPTFTAEVCLPIAAASDLTTCGPRRLPGRAWLQCEVGREGKGSPADNFASRRGKNPVSDRSVAPWRTWRRVIPDLTGHF